MRVVYFEILRDVFCEIPKLNNWWIKLSFGIQCRCSEYQMKNYIKNVKKQQWKERGQLLFKSLVSSY